MSLRRLLKRSPVETPSATAAAPTNTTSTTHALDVLADVLKTFGSHGFDLPEQTKAEFATQCDGWTQHVLLGTDPDGQSDAPSGTAPVRRRWKDVRDFVRTRRKAEVAFVTEHFGTLKGALVELASGLRRALAEDDVVEHKIQEQLVAIEQAALTMSHEEIRQLVPSAVGSIRGALQTRRKTVREQIQSMGRTLSQLRADLAQSRHDAETDPLTRLYNHGAFQRTFEHLSLLTEATGEPLVLAIADIDHFKKFNDQFGHAAGDAVLKATADCIVRTFPRKNDFVARYGGEEFALLLRDVDVPTAHKLVQRLVDNVEAMTVPYEHNAHRVTISVGYTMLAPGETLKVFFDRADKALYRAKDAGRNQASFSPIP